MFKAKLVYTESDVDDWRDTALYGLMLIAGGLAIAAVLAYCGVKTFWVGIGMAVLGVGLAFWSWRVMKKIRRNIGRPIVLRRL